MNARTTQLLKTLLRDVPRGRWLLVLSTLLAACASGASVALMGVSAWLLSRAAEMPPVLYLEAAAVGVRFFGISRGVFRYAERLVGHDLALRMQGALRMRVYDRLSRTTLLGRRRGDLLVRVTADVDAVLDMVVRVIVPACASSLVIIGTTVLLTRPPGSDLRCRDLVPMPLVARRCATGNRPLTHRLGSRPGLRKPPDLGRNGPTRECGRPTDHAAAPRKSRQPGTGVG